MSDARQRALENIRVKVHAQPVLDHLKRMSDLAPERVRKAMGRTVAMWHAEALPRVPVRASRALSVHLRLSGNKWNRVAAGPQRYTSVGRGQLKKRTQPFVRQVGGAITGGLVFMTDYAIWLVAGTRRIAKGRVMAWREGQPAITDWPAKKAGGNPRGAMPLALPWRRKALEFFKRDVGKDLTK